MNVVGLLAVAVLVWILYEWYEHQAIQYSSTVVETNKINRELRICLISDLHNNRKKYSNIVEQLKENHTDLILIAGDLVDKHKESNENALRFLEELRKIAPIYYSYGNHESSLAAKRPELWQKYLDAIPEDVYCLDNEVCNVSSFPEIFISGLTLPKCFYKKGALCDDTDALPKLPPVEDGFHLLLAHNPEYVHLYQEYKADLILSGHLHGGLMRLPFLGGLISPRLRYPGRDAGLTRLEDGQTSLFISRGLGSHTIPLRFFNRVEINFILLKGTKEME